LRQASTGRRPASLPPACLQVSDTASLESAAGVRRASLTRPQQSWRAGWPLAKRAASCSSSLPPASRSSTEQLHHRRLSRPRRVLRPRSHPRPTPRPRRRSLLARPPPSPTMSASLAATGTPSTSPTTRCAGRFSTRHLPLGARTISPPHPLGIQIFQNGISYYIGLMSNPVFGSNTVTYTATGGTCGCPAPQSASQWVSCGPSGAPPPKHILRAPALALSLPGRHPGRLLRLGRGHKLHGCGVA